MTPLEESLSVLNDLVRSGKVRYIGLCNMAAWQIMKALAISDRRHWTRFESVQAYYTIAGRDLERDVIPLAEDQKLGLMVWSPLAGGLLSGKYSADGKGPEGARRTNFDFPIVDKPRASRCVEAMRPIAPAHGVSVAQIALAWLLSRPTVTTVIIGATTAEQLEDNIALDPCASGRRGTQIARRRQSVASTGVSRLDAGIPGPVSCQGASQGMRVPPPRPAVRPSLVRIRP